MRTTSPQHTPVRPWRATLIVGIVVSLAVAAAAFGWWFARESPPHQGPIVLVSVDGLSGADLAAYGATPGKTPAIDALAADGVVFERAYTNSPQRVPAHASLLTGQLPPAHGVRHDVGFVLAPTVRTLAEVLQNRGFATGAAVSSLLLRRESGLAQGFGFFDAGAPPAANAAGPAVARGGRDTFEAATRWLKMQSGQRYFLFLHIPRADADAVIADTVAWLKQRDLYDGATMIVVGSRGDAGNGVWLEESALRVPLIVKQPDSEGAGTRVRPPVQHTDLLPTILDLVRAPIPGEVSGRSLRAVLDDPEEVLPNRIVYSESLAARFILGSRPRVSVASARHRLVRDEAETLVPIDPPGPAVTAADSPDAAPLRTALDDILDGTRVTDPAPLSAMDRRLAAQLGFLEAPRTLPIDERAADPTALAAGVDGLTRAAVLVGADRVAEAIRVLQPVAAARPELSVLQYQLGELLVRTGQLDAAAAAFRRAAGAAPTSVEFATLVADTLRRAGKLAEARKQIDLAIVQAENASAVDRADAHEVAARIALAQKDAAAAAVHAQLASEADASRPLPAFVTGRVAAEENRHAEAATAFAEAIEAEQPGGSRIAELHQSYGDTLSHLEKYPEAEEQFKLEIAAFPEALPAYMSLATLYRATNRDDEAAAVVSQMLESVPTPAAYAAATRLWTALGDREQAGLVRNEALRRFPDESTRALLDRAARR